MNSSRKSSSPSNKRPTRPSLHTTNSSPATNPTRPDPALTPRRSGRAVRPVLPVDPSLTTAPSPSSRGARAKGARPRPARAHKLNAPADPDDAEVRRLQLLARLNAIERQRREIARSSGVSASASASAAGGGGVSFGAPAVRKRARASLPEVRAKKEGERRRSESFRDTKRPRGGAPSPAVSARAETATRKAAAAPPRPVLDIGGIGGGQANGGLERFGMASAGSPREGGRVGRLRTPSVLLAKQPGEGEGKGKVGNNQVGYCLRIVKDMLRLKDSHAFSKPIDQLWPSDQLPGYFEMIHSPMDLRTVQEKLERGGYMRDSDVATTQVAMLDDEAFKKDMLLVFNNARTYNRPGDIFYQAAGRLTEKFESKFAMLPAYRDPGTEGAGKKKKKKEGGGGAAGGALSRKDGKRRKAASKNNADDGPSSDAKAKNAAKNAKRRAKAAANSAAAKNGGSEISASPKDPAKMTRAEMDQRLDALNYQIAIVEARSPAPSPTGSSLPSYMIQAQALYNVPMVFDEKIKLTQDVGRLSGDKLQKIIALVSKNAGSTMEVNNNEEIELDMDSLDNQTLRDMQAFVNQTLYRGRKGNGMGPPGSDELAHLSRDQLRKEIDKITSLIGAKDESRGEEESPAGRGKMDGDLKKPKSFYESSSSSESSSSGSSSDSDSSSGSDDSDDSGSASGDDKAKRRERNLEHMRKMGQVVQGGDTPLASPSYSGVPASTQGAGHFSPQPSPPGLPRYGEVQKETSPAAGDRSPSP